MSDRVIRHIVVRGGVQGVGYRAFVEDEARQRSLQGWVRNRRDGSVQALAVGPDEAVQLFVQSCHRGPSMARVDGVKVEPAQGIVGESGFSQKPTV